MTEPLTTPPSDAREALLADLAERALNAVQPEIDRLRTNLTTVFHQLKAAERESEQRLGELLFWEFEYREAMDNYKGENWQVGQLRTELEQARAEPPRPSPNHMAVYIDQHNSGAWVDYPTVPPGDDVLPLVTANEEASSRASLADGGVELRIVGWIK